MEPEDLVLCISWVSLPHALRIVCISSHGVVFSAYFYLVSKEFRAKASSVARNDYRTIEHLLRYGYKQKKLIEMPGFTGATAINK